jgi:hypothetical protein
MQEAMVVEVGGPGLVHFVRCDVLAASGDDTECRSFVKPAGTRRYVTVDSGEGHGLGVMGWCSSCRF